MITADEDEGVKPLALTFNGSASHDPDTIDSIASYTFNFGDGSDDVTQTSPTIAHTFSDAGEYIIRLVVTDSRGKVSANTAMFKIDVEEPPVCPTNVALFSAGAGALASSTHSSGLYPAGAVINGDRTGGNWGTTNGGWNDGTRAAYPDTLEIAFPGAQRIDQINVFTLQNDWQSGAQPTLLTQADAEGILHFSAYYWDGNQSVLIESITGKQNANR